MVESLRTNSSTVGHGQHVKFCRFASPSSAVLHQTLELVETHGTAAIPGRTNQGCVVGEGKGLVAPPCSQSLQVEIHYTWSVSSGKYGKAWETRWLSKLQCLITKRYTYYYNVPCV